MADQDSSQKDLYFVAVKLFIENDGKLLIFKDRFGDWDLPGGRIKKHEFDVPLEQVIKRKMEEELGSHVEYKLGSPAVFMRHERIDAIDGKETRIFAVGYKASLVSGDIRSTVQHPEFLWVDKNSFKPEQYFKGGWLKGVQEYLAINN